VFVDLNSIRAKMNNTPETSKHTSIHQRIRGMAKSRVLLQSA
jgi:hypothetical protein